MKISVNKNPVSPPWILILSFLDTLIFPFSISPIKLKDSGSFFLSDNLTLLSSGTGSFSIIASVPTGDLILYQWQESRDNGNTWFDVPEVSPYSGTKTSKIVFTQPDPSIDGYKYRVILTIPSYVCEEIALDYEGEIIWDKTKPAGQFKKPSSNDRLISTGWNTSSYTSFEEGLQMTCDWFVKNYPNVRGM